jgi:2-polyprenyl-6-methoxyphenol hydroxylase-like FAD-dependent oxidoreductase
MSSLVGRHAVVVGAGIGGLSMAGVLARYFDRVDVLERDHLPSSAVSRTGTPQDRHPHALLSGGLEVLSEMFPGFQTDLANAGAIPVRLAEDFRHERGDVGLLPMRDLGMSLLCASRPLIESVLRRRITAMENVTLRSACRVTRILASKPDGVVTGVEFDSNSGRLESLDADLVVDASGRAAPTLALQDTLAWGGPNTTEVGVDITYATAVVKKPANAPTDWKAVITLPHPPAVSLSAILLPAEDDRWMITVADYGQKPPLQTWNSFLGALKQLVTPTLYNVLRDITPPENLRHYGFPASVWRHFEQLQRLPLGLLPVADSICRFNPVYGQGMAVGAKQARLLQAILEKASTKPDPLTIIQTDFMAQVEPVIQTPWDLATSADLAFPTTRGDRPDNFTQSRDFEAALFRAVVADPVVHKAMMEVFQLLQPGRLLQEPHIMQRIEAVSAKDKV